MIVTQNSFADPTDNNGLARSRELADIDSDTLLLSENSLADLDVSVSEGRVQLRQRGLWERIIAWFSFGAPDSRIGRLRDYIGIVYSTPLAADVQFQKYFYRWLRYRFGSIIDLSRLSPQIIATLSPALVKTRAAAQKALPNSREKATLCWEACMLEVALAKDLGIVPVSAGGGVNDAQFGLGLNSKPLTVIKTRAKDPRLFNERTFGFRTQAEICQHDPRIAGTIAAKADQFFGFAITPHTDRDLRGHSHQVFVAQTVDASQAKFKGKLLKDRPIDDFDSDELELLLLRSCFNFAIGDIDTKDDKLRMKLKPTGEEISECFETDNDHSFPKIPLNRKKDWFTLRKTYSWRHHKWARHTGCKVRPESHLERALMRVFDHDQVMAFVNATNRAFPGFFTESRLSLLLERIAIMKAAFELGIPVADLGAIYSMEFFNEQNTKSLPQEKRDDVVLLKAAIDDYRTYPGKNPLQLSGAPPKDSPVSLISSIFHWCVSWVY